MIKFIVNVFVSKIDTNGNTYRSARIYNTKTGKQIFIKDVGGESNTILYIQQMLKLDYSETLNIVSEISRKELFAMNGRNNGIYEHELTVKMLKAK